MGAGEAVEELTNAVGFSLLRCRQRKVPMAMVVGDGEFVVYDQCPIPKEDAAHIHRRMPTMEYRTNEEPGSSHNACRSTRILSR